MIGFVAFCVFSSAFYFHALDIGKILVGIGATLCPLLAITCTYGIVSMTGSRVNSLLFVMPFLIMGESTRRFSWFNSWQRQIRHNYSSPQRMSVVYEECGPSISITSVTKCAFIRNRCSHTNARDPSILPGTSSLQHGLNLNSVLETIRTNTLQYCEQ
ncbi:hypothetical protein OSTOST_21290, partial [Ostertagia ostertagi]